MSSLSDRAPGNAEPAQRWFRRLSGTADSAQTLLCFPHAGGTAGYFRALGRALEPEFSVIAVQYPGRQDRLDEEPIQSIQSYASSIRSAWDRYWYGEEFSVLGHSMGALIAFEFAVGLAQDDCRNLHTLIASAHAAPEASTSGFALGAVSEENVIDHLKALAAPGTELLTDPELASLFLPAIMNDLRAVAAYTPTRAEILSCNVLAISGAQDWNTPKEHVAAWSKTTTGRFTHKEFAGGHFFLSSDGEAVSSFIHEAWGLRR